MKVLTDNQYYGQIANVIREQNGTSNTYTPPQMVSALKDLFYEEVEGVPPITFQGIGENLLDYRIDGASGGVGERTKNLVNKNNMLQGYWAYANGTFASTNTWICTPKIECSGNTAYTYQFSNTSRWSGFVYYDENGNYISTSNVQNDSSTPYRTYTAISPSNAKYLVVNIAGFPGTADTISVSDLINFQLEEGSTATDYEPYGYKVPVVVSGKNLFDELYPGINDTENPTVNYRSIYVGDGQFTLSTTTSQSNLFLLKGQVVSGASTAQNGVYINHSKTVNSQNGYITIGYRNYQGANPVNNDTQLEKGSTATDYEPYIEPTTTNIYLDNPIRTVEDEVEYIDYSEQKHHRVRKNLLQNTATTQTINGVTFTVNNDKSITCNGTATGTTAITINTIFSINSTKISGCPMGGSWSSFELDLLNINTNNVDVIDTGNGAVIQNENSYRVRIRIASGYTCNNLTFYPMIRKADIEDDTYEPYIENTEVDVTLPAIPTLDGTNTLSIGTTVQPSNVYVKSRHESSYEAAMRERYEEAQAQLDALESEGE